MSTADARSSLSGVRCRLDGRAASSEAGCDRQCEETGGEVAPIDDGAGLR